MVHITYAAVAAKCSGIPTLTTETQHTITSTYVEQQHGKYDEGDDDNNATDDYCEALLTLLLRTESIWNIKKIK